MRREKSDRDEPKNSSGGRIRTYDLRVMSPTSYLAAPPRINGARRGRSSLDGRRTLRGPPEVVKGVMEKSGEDGLGALLRSALIGPFGHLGVHPFVEIGDLLGAKAPGFAGGQGADGQGADGDALEA